MSAAPSAPPPYPIALSAALSAQQQQLIADLLALAPKSYVTEADETQAEAAITIKALVDGRGLACPMPLLKTKVALREVAVGESLYVIATDPNSQADITAFCAQSQASNADSLAILVNTVTDNAFITDHTAQAADTIFHFIITKTDSN
ncbi:sulfurtransferase TusA family protein [Psychrobacter sp. AH5]|uniref:sulfurtransferase TusA family protein n=1 Tax=Psychrobacter sp. AH5 TaxID=2937433 RepID=UPI00333F84A5